MKKLYIVDPKSNFLIVKNFRKFISDVDEQISFFESGTLEFALEQMDIMSSTYNVEESTLFGQRIVEYTINVQTDLKLRKGNYKILFQGINEKYFLKKYIKEIQKQT